MRFYRLGGYEQAFDIFQELAADGNPEAQNYLGQMFLKGQGIEQDDTQALYWFRQAAAWGDPEAQYYLGSMHARGLGVQKDYVSAYMWADVSARQGYEQAILIRNYLIEALTPDQVHSAEARSQAFQEMSTADRRIMLHLKKDQ